MAPREHRIVEAAFGVFMRYGVRRTTMAEIAEAAGVSRQTLYGVFSSKDDVLVAVIGHVTDQTLAALDTAWRGCDTLGERLDAYFEICVLRSWDLLHAAPDAADVLNGHNVAGTAAVRAGNLRKRAALSAALLPSRAAIERRGLTVERLAHLIQATAFGFEVDARQRDELVGLLASLKTLVLDAAQ